MNLMPLANRLQDAGLGVKGTNLFIGMLPAAAERATLLRNPLQGTPIDYELPGFYKTQFQLIVRVPAGFYVDGETLIGQVIASLTLTEQQVEDHFFNYCRPRTEPVVYPLSNGNMLEFATMFDCCFVKG